MKTLTGLLFSLTISSFFASLLIAAPSKAECPGVGLLPDNLMSRVWIQGEEVTQNKGLLAPGSKLLRSAVILNEKAYAANLHLLDPANDEKLKSLTLTLLSSLKNGVCEYEVKDEKGIKKLGTFALVEPALLEPAK